MSTPNMVPMLAPDGTAGYIPADRVTDALKAGGKLGVEMQAPDGVHGIIPRENLVPAIQAGGKVIHDSAQYTTKFEQDRAPAVEEAQTVRNPWSEVAHAAPGVASAVASEVGNVAKAIPGMVAGAFEGPTGVARLGVETGLKVGEEDAQRKQAGRSVPYRVVAGAGSVAGVNAKGMEDAADVGDYKKVLGIAGGDAAVATAPVVGEAVVKKFGPAVEKFAGSAVDKFQGAGVQKAVMPEASALPPKAISGAEDIFRAAAPTGKNAGFRENVMVAAPDLADVAHKVNIAEAKGGVINPDMRVRATVDALDSHLKDMYEKERVPQIQAHADVPVKVGSSPDAIRGLEYLENTAGTDELRGLATKAIEGRKLTLAEADKLAVSANEYLKSFERAPGDVKMQMQQTSPKVSGLKSLDVELGRTLNDVLTAFGEEGIRGYERRFAAVSEIRNQLRDRMNAVELTRQNPVKTLRSYIGSPKEAIASASQAAVSDVNIGRKLQTAFQKLRESGITAQKAPKEPMASPQKALPPGQYDMPPSSRMQPRLPEAVIDGEYVDSPQPSRGRQSGPYNMPPPERAQIPATSSANQKLLPRASSVQMQAVSDTSAKQIANQRGFRSVSDVEDAIKSGKVSAKLGESIIRFINARGRSSRATY